MSRFILKGKVEGSELVVGLDPPLQEWFWQYWPKGNGEGPDAPVTSEAIAKFAEEQDEGPEVWETSRSQYDLMIAVKKYADLTHELTQQVLEAIGGDLDPGATRPDAHWAE